MLRMSAFGLKILQSLHLITRQAAELCVIMRPAETASSEDGALRADNQSAIRQAFPVAAENTGADA
jgi:hypothetical protein